MRISCEWLRGHERFSARSCPPGPHKAAESGSPRQQYTVPHAISTKTGPRHQLPESGVPATQLPSWGFRPKSPADIGSELMDAAASQHFVASMDTGRITGDQLRQLNSPGSNPHLNEGSEDFFLNDSMSELLHLSHSQRLDVPLNICLKQWFLSTKHEATFYLSCFFSHIWQP